ncbi:amino acid ABC transporter permease [Streptomyces sp. NPDC002520]
MSGQELPGPAKTAERDGDVVVPARHPGRLLALLGLAVLAAMALHLLVTNERLQWPVVWQYLFSAPILTGVVRTLELTAIAMVMGLVIGIVVAVGRLSPNPLLAKVAWLYSWFFRGTPLLVQLLFWFYLSALLPRISVGIPFGPEFASAGTNTLITPFLAAVLGLGLNEGAYMSEIVRSGILAVPRGQIEAGQAIGMSRGAVMRRVVLPQAMRVIIPPTGNETIGMLKYTSLVLVIGYAELLTSASLIYSRTFQTIPLLIVAALWYLAITAALSVAQYYVERHFGRGFQITTARRSRPSRLLRGQPASAAGAVDAAEAPSSLRSAS